MDMSCDGMAVPCDGKTPFFEMPPMSQFPVSIGQLIYPCTGTLLSKSSKKRGYNPTVTNIHQHQTNINQWESIKPIHPNPSRCAVPVVMVCSDESTKTRGLSSWPFRIGCMGRSQLWDPIVGWLVVT